MNGYDIIDFVKIEEHITFIRINPTDIKLTLKEILFTLSDLSWLNNFDEDYKESFLTRAKNTINYITLKINKGDQDKLTEDSGEYVVSELARKSIVNKLDYLDVPLAELFKKQKSGNPGFDIYSENKENIILFGEAKYTAKKNAYGKAFKQIKDFIESESDSEDLPDISWFCSNQAVKNFNNSKRGYIAAFSSTNRSTDFLIKNLIKNADFIELRKYNELICVAVNI